MPHSVFSCRPAPSNTPSGGVHPKWCHKRSSVHAACTKSNTAPKWLPPGEEGKITINPCSTVAPAVESTGGRHFVWLQALSTNEGFSEDNTGRQYFGIQCDCGSDKCQSDSTQAHWPINNTGPKPYPQQAKRAIADDWTEGKNSSATTAGCMHHTHETPWSTMVRWWGDIAQGTTGPQDFSFIRTQFQLSEQVSDLEHRVMENKETKREEQQEY